MKKGWLLFFVVIAFLLWQWYRAGGVGAVILIVLLLLFFALLLWIKNSRRASDNKEKFEDNLVAEIQYKRGKDLVVLKKYQGKTQKQNEDYEYQSNKKNSNVWEDLEKEHWENGWEDDERRKEK